MAQLHAVKYGMQKIDLENDFVYFKSGEKPKLLIHAGTHGDEYGVIEIITKYLNDHIYQLPSFIYVPRVSPSAVRNKSRYNSNGLDMNRKFFSHSTDDEVKKNITVMQGHSFDRFISFHEDPESLNHYYIYEVNREEGENEDIIQHNQLLTENNIDLLEGLDDPNDPTLGYHFTKGYLKLKHASDEEDGTISAWALGNRVAKDYLLPEIPGKTDVSKKKLIIDSFFEMVVKKMFTR